MPQGKDFVDIALEFIQKIGDTGDFNNPGIVFTDDNGNDYKLDSPEALHAITKFLKSRIIR